MTNSAFITGAATGIGKALSQKLDAEGWRVFAGYNNTPPDALLSECSKNVVAIKANVTDDEEIKSAAKQVSKALGSEGLTLLVNNAASTGGAGGPLETISIDDFKWLMEINFWGAIRVTQAFLPLIPKHADSKIINVSSASAFMTVPLGSSYPTTKCALQTMTEHLRMELAPFGIQVTDLSPGGIDTAMTWDLAAQEQELWDAIPKDRISAYKKEWRYPGAVFDSGFEFGSTEKFAEQVFKKIIEAKKIKPLYALGPGSAALPLVRRLLPRRGVERIYSKMFRTKR